jgi:DNA-binding transcriptional MerR regulator
MESVMRIGELSRRTGVSPELLRAWEQRYGLLRPTRSAGGFRLYSSADEIRVRRTTELIAEGLSAAEAARLAATAAGADARDNVPLVTDLATRLQRSLDEFDAAAAQATLDRLFAAVSVEFALTEVLIPYLHDLGERWAAGTVTVAQEHFAANLVRGRLLGLAQDWGGGGTSTAVAACLPGEAHDLGLVMLGLGLAGHLPRRRHPPRQPRGHRAGTGARAGDPDDLRPGRFPRARRRDRSPRRDNSGCGRGSRRGRGHHRHPRRGDRRRHPRGGRRTRALTTALIVARWGSTPACRSQRRALAHRDRRPGRQQG